MSWSPSGVVLLLAGALLVAACGSDDPGPEATVTVVARDSVEGFCGRAFEVELP